MTATMAEEQPMQAGTALMETIQPDAAGPDGMLFGGNALCLMGRAAFAAACRHTNGKMMMAGVDDLQLHRPVPVGHLLELTARIVHVDAAAMTILVDGMMQPASGGRRTLALSGYFRMLAVT